MPPHNASSIPIIMLGEHKKHHHPFPNINNLKSAIFDIT